MLTKRLSSKIQIDEASGCWNFTGSVTKNGYGRVWDGERADWAHRVYYRALKGEIPDGLVIDHLCRNRRCVNPDHLEAVTDKINTIRGVCPEVTRARHKKKTMCKRGHPLFGENVRISNEGRRVCIKCSLEHARNYRVRTSSPDKRIRAIVTPVGTFPSVTEAAQALGLEVSTLSYRARKMIMGVAYCDVLLRLANAPAAQEGEKPNG